MWLFCLLAVTS